MKTKFVLSLTVAGFSVIALAGCMSSPGSSPAANSPAAASSSPSSSAAASAAAASGFDLSTSTSSLGTIVVNGKGLTAYFYDVDKPNSGKSSCTGQCASLWPAITTTSSSPNVMGVTGTLGVITDPAGAKQITINGRPIYTYAADSKPGDVNGQGAQGVWHVISPTGSEIK